MRVAVGSILAIQGISCLLRGGRTSEFSICLLLAACGASLFIGFLTPVVSALAVVAILADTLSIPPVVAWSLLGGKLASPELVVMAAAIALLGPGAFSFDAYLFGRHEIVIPPASRSPKF
jgi:hypothetical protein